MLNSKNNCEDSKYKCKQSKNHPVLELTLVESYYIRSIFLQISNNWFTYNFFKGKEIQGGQNVISKNNFNLNT